MIKFAPLRVPLERRLQTLCITLTFWSQPIGLFLTGILLLIPVLRLAMLAYLTWILYDHYVLQTSAKGGRRWQSIYRSKLWHYTRDYCPVTLVKTADLPANKNYVMSCEQRIQGWC